jgi:hypothetical protein
MLAVEDSPAGLESAKAAGCAGPSPGDRGPSRFVGGRPSSSLQVPPFYVQ